MITRERENFRLTKWPELKQDRPDDEKAGVKSLAVWLGKNLKYFLTLLGVLQIVFLFQAAREAHASAVLWVFGIGVWAISIPWSILSLNTADRGSGAHIFLANAVLSIYLSAVTAVDVWITSKRAARVEF